MMAGGVRFGKKVYFLNETEQQMEKKKRQEDLQRLHDFRPIDDDFMRCLFKDNIPLAELVLRIITGKQDLVITECETQKDMKRLAGARSICLDAYGTDSKGKRYDLEIQRADKGADPHRARYHSSVMDIENLDAGQEFKELPDTYTIFITERDFYGKGEPVYVIERVNLTTGNEFGDGEHILYVNGEYRGESELGRLMHDFNCINAADMNFNLLAERTRYLKENPEGVDMMCKSMEDMRNEAVENTSLQNIKNLMETMKLSAEQAMDALKIPDSDRMRYMERL
jgi:predicted transposase/invertase (TIGR01784 family)